MNSTIFIVFIYFIIFLKFYLIRKKNYDYWLLFLINFLIKIVFYLIFSFTYFSVNMSVNLTNNFFKELNFINFNNKFKNFLLNIIYLSSNINYSVFSSKLYFNNRKNLIFNPPKIVLPEFDNIVNKMLKINSALNYVFASYVDYETQKISGRFQININIHNKCINQYAILALRFTKYPEIKIYKVNLNSNYLELEKINLNFFCKSITDKNKYHWAVNPVLEKYEDISYYNPNKSLLFFKETSVNPEHTLIALNSLIASLHKLIDIPKAGKIYKIENICEIKTLHGYIVNSNFNLFIDPRFNDIF